MKNAILLFSLLLAFVLGNAQNNSTNKTLAGKLYFANQPFANNHNGSKNTFSSHEFIYGRLEGDGKKLYEIFKLKDPGKVYENFGLYYTIIIFKDGNRQNYVEKYVLSFKNINLNIDALNFDILPEPPKTKSIIRKYSGFDGNERKQPGNLYDKITSYNFKEEGTYQIEVEISYDTNDEWGKLENESKWPVFKATFDFEFSKNDIAALQQNEKLAKAALDNLEKTEYDERMKIYNAEKAKKDATDLENKEMPEGWTAKSYPLTSPYTLDYVKTVFKKEYPDEIIVKTYVEQADEWVVRKNNLGLPTYMESWRIMHIYSKTKAGVCGYWPFYFKKDYLGGGRYGKAYLVFGGFKELPCSKMK